MRARTYRGLRLWLWGLSHYATWQPRYRQCELVPTGRYERCATGITGRAADRTRFGLSVVAGMGDGVRDSAAVFAQNDTGTYSAEAARFQGSNAYRLGATGSVVVLSDRGFLTRWLDDSSGTVKVADYPDVQVNAENHPIAHTDSHGIALMPRLRSFEYNHISMEQADLQLDEQIGSVQVDARPACRRGVLIDLPVHSTRGALLTIVLKDGSPLPAGATVKWIRGSQVFPVAMRGEVYVTGLKNHNRLRTLWNGQTCLIDFDMPGKNSPLPHIKPIVCAVGQWKGFQSA